MSFSASTIGAFQALSTPLYYYDMDLLGRILDRSARLGEEKGYAIHYALKANANERILRMVRERGFGVDCVSGNEIDRALACGFEGKDIVFAGVGKSDEELRKGLDNGIRAFNCESKQELEVLNDLAGSLGSRANVALRVNPNVNANTHQYITTGLEENKFGIDPWELDAVVEQLQRLDKLHLQGLHFHIGSQVTDLSAFKGLCTRVNEVSAWFRDRNLTVQDINVGGGLGVDHKNPAEDIGALLTDYFGLFERHLDLRPDQQVHFEPGRVLVAHCGTLIARVLYVKAGVNTNFAILDAGMTELMRPALYLSYHGIEKLTGTERPLWTYDVVGPICESSDCFGKRVELPEVQRGDLIAIRSTGAYGETMAHRYNLRSPALAYYSDDLTERVEAEKSAGH